MDRAWLPAPSSAPSAPARRGALPAHLAAPGLGIDGRPAAPEIAEGVGLLPLPASQRARPSGLPGRRAQALSRAALPDAPLAASQGLTGAPLPQGRAALIAEAAKIPPARRGRGRLAQVLLPRAGI